LPHLTAVLHVHVAYKASDKQESNALQHHAAD